MLPSFGYFNINQLKHAQCNYQSSHRVKVEKNQNKTDPSLSLTSLSAVRAQIKFSYSMCVVSLEIAYFCERRNSEQKSL